MRTIEIALDDASLCRPATGRRILSSTKCKPSPATLFVYLEGANVFDLALTISGMACGPESNAIHIGIDLAHGIRPLDE